MADFQQKVNGQPSEGLPGQLVDGVFTPAMGYLSDGTLEAGMFAVTAANKNDAVPFACKGVSGGRVVGVVMRTQTGQLESPFVSSTTVYEKGAPVAIAARGRIFYKVTAGAPTVGQHVIVNPANGAVTFSTVAYNSPVANDSGWEVVRLAEGKTSAAVGDIIIIENLG